jgi:ubiquinone/menaquinone biosynthesis C-methylase UbiE
MRSTQIGISSDPFDAAAPDAIAASAPIGFNSRAQASEGRSEAMRIVRSALAPFYRLLERAGGFALHQRLGQPTLERYRRLIAEDIGPTSGKHVLDIGCGIGSFRPCFAGAYTGVDINPAYIEKARALQSGAFATMNGTRLDFADASFDEVVTIATLHHVNDEEAARTVTEAIRVCRPGGHVHVIEAILPVTPNPLKTLLFRLDRGDHPRTLAQLLSVLAKAGPVLSHRVLPGPLHDTVYVRVGRRRPEATLTPARAGSEGPA